MSETTEENMVPMIGTGELVDLDVMKAALLKLSDKNLANWYVKYYKPLNEAVGMIRKELISRMVKSGSEVLHAPNGQRVELKNPPRRTCDKDILSQVEHMISVHYGQDLTLYRVKETIEPNMNEIKKARKIGMDVTMAIAKGLHEEPGYPSIKIEGVDKERAKIFEPR